MAEADEERGKPARPAAGADRRERLAAAMRENLKRRKAQARGRAPSEPPAEPVEEG
ncbi:MAG: hypothetical protein U1E52_13975 [Geminicoccaceae bacterium]